MSKSDDIDAAVDKAHDEVNDEFGEIKKIDPDAIRRAAEFVGQFEHGAEKCAEFLHDIAKATEKNNDIVQDLYHNYTVAVTILEAASIDPLYMYKVKEKFGKDTAHQLVTAMRTKAEEKRERGK